MTEMTDRELVATAMRAWKAAVGELHLPNTERYVAAVEAETATLESFVAFARRVQTAATQES